MTHHNPTGIVAHAASFWPLQINDELFGYYLQGNTPEEAVSRMLELNPSEDLALDPVLLKDDVDDHFQMFAILREYLRNPPTFTSFRAMPIGAAERRQLLALYYGLDEEVASFFFGTRMSKSDIEAAEEKWKEDYTRRFVENMKRVSKYVISGYRQKDGISLSKEVPMRVAIERQFQIPQDLASEYATITFGLEHHLNARLFRILPFVATASICSAMCTWCDPTNLFISEVFAQSMNRVRAILQDSRVLSEAHSMVLGFALPERRWPRMNELTPGASSQSASRESLDSSTSSRFSKKLTSEFLSILKGISRICGQFSSRKDLKDFFDGLVEKVIFPFVVPTSCSETSSNLLELSIVFGVLATQFPAMQCVSPQDHTVVDGAVQDLFAVLKLVTQMVVAHECKGAVSQLSALGPMSNSERLPAMAGNLLQSFSFT